MTRTTTTRQPAHNRQTVANRTHVNYKIQNPYKPKTNCYKGQTHCHASGSWDSIISPIDLCTFYKEQGYDWVSISEHNELCPEPENMPEGMIFIPGMEYTWGAHMVITNTTRPFEGDHTENPNLDTQDEIDKAVSDGSFVSIAHPLATIWNGGTPEWTFWGETPILRWENYHAIAARSQVPPVYCDHLIDTILSRGQKVWLTQEDDLHVKENEPLPTGSDPDIGGLFVFADELTEEAIMESLFKGNFYCGQRGIDLNIDVDETARTITLSCD